jgi:predicted nucleotidyltransferase
VASRINVDRAELAEFCQRHHIRRLSLFGSVLRDDFGPDSDVDVLVEFEPGHQPGLIRLHGIEQELSRLLDGRELDLVNPKFLNQRIRDRVLAEAEVQFAA